MPITAIIISGGRATRMGGVDKGLILLQNRSLIQHVISRLQSQTDEILINANREIAQYEEFGLNVLPDESSEFLGPLSGILLGLKHAKNDLVLSVPCDSPLLPPDLSERLYNGMLESHADIACATSNSNTHPVFCLMKKSVLPSLQAFLDAGERKVSAWQKSLKYIEVDFSDRTEAFTNLNTLDELRELELKL
ncbi:MAG: molybdenum cofactor guanylyltransferase MobA [Methylophilaceae bacterium]